jgi:bifunctional enzyme CysN/CysC
MISQQILDQPTGASAREQMNIVVIGHVDHGKSTLIGRLLADTDSLPEGRLDMVREQCVRHSKPFEYAFLLDALKDEQSQGITIDSARCFFQSASREYIIIDAPGHIEFLKNMISGAARAEAGLLVIDAKEGVRENSRRHGYLMSLLGVRQLAVCVNKMDLVDYDEKIFTDICAEYSAFLERVHVQPSAFIPVSAREGDNIVTHSDRMPWYDGVSALEMLDAFKKEPSPVDRPLRLPVQDVYKFTAEGDDRRIVAGRIETGSLSVGDDIVFLPSGKRSRVADIVGFNTPPTNTATAGQSTGVTLEEQVYVRPGELMCRADETPPVSSSRLRVNLLWLGRQPMIKNKRYKMKLACTRVSVWLTVIHTVLDASELTTDANREQIERHDVAECELEMLRPVACDLAEAMPQTGRFVIIDNYEIAGGGIVLESVPDGGRMVREHVRQRESAWERTPITPGMRSGRYNQNSALLVLSGPQGVGKAALARALEAHLFERGRLVYYLGVSNSLAGINADLIDTRERDEHLWRLGEIAHLFTDAGLIIITTVSDLDDYELALLEQLNEPNELLYISVGDVGQIERRPDLAIPAGANEQNAVQQIHNLLQAGNHLVEYYL